MSNAESVPSTPGKGLHIGLWVVQVLLALAFLMGGAMKLFSPLDALIEQMPWVSGPMGSMVRFIGVVEVLGALGLVLPSATRIVPKLTSLAAGGLVIVMVLALITHVVRGEMPMVVPNVILGGMAAFVAWGRFVKAPIAPRS